MLYKYGRAHGDLAQPIWVNEALSKDNSAV